MGLLPLVHGPYGPLRLFLALFEIGFGQGYDLIDLFRTIYKVPLYVVSESAITLRVQMDISRAHSRRLGPDNGLIGLYKRS